MQSLLFILLLLCYHTPVLAAPPVLDDFAYGCQLPQVDDTGVYALTLPLAVYEKVTRSDLGDLRVFNGAGETMPHALRSLQKAEEPKQIRQTIPFFPLQGKPSPTTSDLSLRVSRHADGTVVTVDAGATALSPVSTWYLLDLHGLEPAPSALELQWAGGRTSVFSVALAQSKDLTHWSPLVGRTVLADLDYQGKSVTARRIALPGNPLPYLRLDCLDCQEPFQLQTVTAVSGTAIPPEQWQWLRLPPQKITPAPGELVLEYELEAKMTVTGLQLGFARTNTLVRAVIESRPATEVGWRLRASGDFYALTLDGKELRNELAQCAATSDRHWRIRIDTRDSGTEGNPSAIQLELGWQADELVFVGRGSGPYTLAFGSTKLAEQLAPPNNALLSVMRDSRSESLIRRIAPGAVQTLAGEQALHPRMSAAAWKKILLWVVLLAGVGLLALMARTIYREMQAKTP